MTPWATLKNRLCPVLFFPLFLEATPDCAVVAGAGKLFSTQSVIIIPLKVTVPYRCSTVDGLLATLKSWNKQNANGWQQFNNCGQLLRKFSFHLIAHNEIMRYWDKDDNFSEYTYQNPYFDCQVGSAWRHNAASGKISHDPRGALMKRISPASIENVWHFVALASAYGNRFSHEIYAVIYIFILAEKKQKTRILLWLWAFLSFRSHTSAERATTSITPECFASRAVENLSAVHAALKVECKSRKSNRNHDVLRLTLTGGVGLCMGRNVPSYRVVVACVGHNEQTNPKISWETDPCRSTYYPTPGDSMKGQEIIDAATLD